MQTTAATTDIMATAQTSASATFDCTRVTFSSPATSPLNSPTAAMHEGYLQKKSSNYMGAFQRRWFVLKDGVLSYYPALNHLANARQQFKIEDLKVVQCPDSSDFDLLLASGKTMRLRADSVQERDDWVARLAPGFFAPEASAPTLADIEDPAHGRESHVVKIQAAVRGRQVRNIQGVLRRRDEDAATAIQAMFRGNHARAVICRDGKTICAGPAEVEVERSVIRGDTFCSVFLELTAFPPGQGWVIGRSGVISKRKLVVYECAGGKVLCKASVDECSVRLPKNERNNRPHTFRVDLVHADTQQQNKYIISVGDQSEMQRWMNCLAPPREPSTIAAAA